MDKAVLLCDARATIGEGPVWCDGTLFWTDPVERQLLRSEGTGLSRTSTAQPIWSLGALIDGGLCGAQDDRLCAVGTNGVLRPGPAAKLAAGCRFNDLTVDAAGRIWVGAMHRGVLAATGALYCASSLGARPVLVARGLGVPNGLAVAADGTRLFVIDTLARTLLAYSIDGTVLGEPVILSDFMGVPGKPDGMTLAPDGSFWVAMWGGGCVAKLTPDGALLATVALPAPHVSSLCVAALDRLLVTTSRMRLAPDALAAAPLSGGLFEIRLAAGGSQ